MSLNLIVRTLDAVDSLGTQKCLLPNCVLSKIGRTGQWAKCFFYPISKRELKNFAVCQLFPREGDDNLVCFLDTSVCGFVADLEDQLILDSVIPFEGSDTVVTQVNVKFFISPVHYMHNMGALSPTVLKDMTQELMQCYNISANCTVQRSEFQQKGVDFIALKVIDSDENRNFIITDNTFIHTENVSLTPLQTKKELVSFDLRPLKDARQQLDDLIDLARIERGYKNQFKVSMNVLIAGPVGCGKTTLVETFLAETKCNVFRVSTCDVVRQYPGETEERLREIFNAARNFEKFLYMKEPIVILLEDIHILCPHVKGSSNSLESGANAMRVSAQLLSLVDELFKDESRIICLATTNNTDALNALAKRPGRFEREISVTHLTEADRKEAIQKYLTQFLPNTNVSTNLLQMAAKQTQGYAVADIALLCRNAAQTALTKRCDNFELIMKDSLKINKPISLLLSDVTAYRTSENFSFVGGMCHMKKELEISVLAGLKREDAFRRFGLTLPKGVLLYGPPGCAKTTVAKCLATEANMTFIATSGAEVYSPYVGCAESFIAKIFDTARKNAPCLIFLDEIDTLVGRRALGSSSLSDVQTRILSTLLTEMDGIICSSNSQQENAHILVVAATNRPDMVDDALMRPGRFDKLIHVPAPDFLSRRSILCLYQHRMPFSKYLDLDNIAQRTKNYSGADICNLCNEAAMNAFQRDFDTNEILYDDFDNILKTSKSSLTQEQITKYYQFEKRFLRYCQAIMMFH